MTMKGEVDKSTIGKPVYWSMITQGYELMKAGKLLGTRQIKSLQELFIFSTSKFKHDRRENIYLLALRSFRDDLNVYNSMSGNPQPKNLHFIEKEEGLYNNFGV